MYQKTKKYLKTFVPSLVLGIFTFCSVFGQKTMPIQEKYAAYLQEFVDMRYGMFICFNIMSYGAKWGEANFDIQKFNPQKLDCNQWAEAASNAQMKFGLLTTKHHEGFCLWDSKTTKYDIASTPYKKDIVRQYVDAFRKKNLKIGLYYSIWDSTHGIDKDKIGTEELQFIKTQISELLSNYGKIDYFVIDGWFWRMGHKEVPFLEIRELIRSLQPDCLITDHTHLQAPFQLDIPYFEGPFGAFPKENNKMPSALGHCSFKGNGWFWNENTPEGPIKEDSTEAIVTKLKTLESRYCNFMLNCMPNRDGLLDKPTLDYIYDIGQKWEPNTKRKPLSTKSRRLIYNIPIVKAEASSGEAANLIDAQQYKTDFKHWVSDKGNDQTITLDLGKIYDNLDVITLVPNHRSKPSPETALSEGNVLKCLTFTSTDNIHFKKASKNIWASNSHYRSILFKPKKARYIKISIRKSIGERVIIAEIEAGSSFKKIPNNL